MVSGSTVISQMFSRISNGKSAKRLNRLVFRMKNIPESEFDLGVASLSTVGDAVSKFGSTPSCSVARSMMSFQLTTSVPLPRVLNVVEKPTLNFGAMMRPLDGGNAGRGF